MIDFTDKPRYDFHDLMQIMRLLRAPGGCPWDRAQTHASTARNFLEETYEFCEAAEQDDAAHMCEELGDVLSQVALHTCIEEEAGRFTIDDVCDGIAKKMIFRHPHVFGSEVCRTADDVLDTWDKVKQVEKSQKTAAESMDSVARSLPALWRAEKLEHKAAKAGFRWASVLGALDKLEEEVRELREAVSSGEGQQEELGDLLLAVCDVASLLSIDPEQALHAACEKFIRRFTLVEQAAGEAGLSGKTEEELCALWAETKLHQASTK